MIDMPYPLTRYSLSYPSNYVKVLKESGFYMHEFWLRYRLVDNWRTLKTSGKSSGSYPLVRAVHWLVIAAGILWLALLWLSIARGDGLFYLLVAYTLIWLYALPMIATILVVYGWWLIRNTRITNVKKLPRRCVARMLEYQVSRLLREKRPLVVAVTGSVGKTSTKLAIAHVLKNGYNVQAHSGNYNSEISLPLSIFDIDLPKTLINPLAWLKIVASMGAKIRHYPYTALVLEMGADEPLDIRKFMRYIHPDIGVLTAIAPVHTEQFGTVQAVLDEKWALALSSKAVLYNQDDDRLRKQSKRLKNRQTGSFGLDSGEFHFKKLRQTKTGHSTEMYIDSQDITVSTKLLGKHSLYALLAAAGVGYLCHIPVPVIKKALQSWQPTPGRMNTLKGKKQSLIIDDSYNSSPTATIAAIDTLVSQSGRHIAVLGSMNELGSYEAEGHRLVGHSCSQIDRLVTIGQAANDYIAPAARKAGLKENQIKTFLSPYEAGEYVASLIKKGDVVLVKGSQNKVFAEEAIKPILANQKDINQLVRQSGEWLRKKKTQFGRR